MRAYPCGHSAEVYVDYQWVVYACRRLGVEHAATFEEVQEARNYLYEVCMPDICKIYLSYGILPLTANFSAVASIQQRFAELHHAKKRSACMQ